MGSAIVVHTKQHHFLIIINILFHLVLINILKRTVCSIRPYLQLSQSKSGSYTPPPRVEHCNESVCPRAYLRLPPNRMGKYEWGLAQWTGGSNPPPPTPHGNSHPAYWFVNSAVINRQAQPLKGRTCEILNAALSRRIIRTANKGHATGGYTDRQSNTLHQQTVIS